MSSSFALPVHSRFVRGHNGQSGVQTWWPRHPAGKSITMRQTLQDVHICQKTAIRILLCFIRPLSVLRWTYASVRLTGRHINLFLCCICFDLSSEISNYIGLGPPYGVPIMSGQWSTIRHGRRPVTIRLLNRLDRPSRTSLTPLPLHHPSPSPPLPPHHYPSPPPSLLLHVF